LGQGATAAFVLRPAPGLLKSVFFSLFNKLRRLHKKCDEQKRLNLEIFAWNHADLFSS
jgi:hypothetical protein